MPVSGWVSTRIHVASPAQFPRPADRDRADALHDRRLPSGCRDILIGLFEQRENRNGHHNRGADPASVRRMRISAALDEEIGHHIGADLIQRPGLPL